MTLPAPPARYRGVAPSGSLRRPRSTGLDGTQQQSAQQQYASTTGRLKGKLRASRRKQSSTSGVSGSGPRLRHHRGKPKGSGTTTPSSAWERHRHARQQLGAASSTAPPRLLTNTTTAARAQRILARTLGAGTGKAGANGAGVGAGADTATDAAAVLERVRANKKRRARSGAGPSLRGIGRSRQQTRAAYMQYVKEDAVTDHFQASEYATRQLYNNTSLLRSIGVGLGTLADQSEAEEFLRAAKVRFAALPSLWLCMVCVRVTSRNCLIMRTIRRATLSRLHGCCLAWESRRCDSLPRAVPQRHWRAWRQMRAQ